jgi:hypothetical protein
LTPLRRRGTMTPHRPRSTAMCKDLTPDDIETVSDALEYLFDLNVVTATADEYGEPGYSLDNPEGMFAIGYWWCRDRECDYAETYDNGGGKRVHGVELHYERLFAILEEGGVEVDFDDEWMVSYSGPTAKAYRTQADSYSWQSSIMYAENVGEYLTPDDDVSEWVEAVVNNPRMCIPAWISDADLSDLGYEERECGYESGWYGQEDNPEAILDAIRDQDPDADVVFKLDRVEQFRVTFCVYVKPGLDNDDDEV